MKKIDSDDFRVAAGKKVDLDKWATIVAGIACDTQETCEVKTSRDEHRQR
jgi:hypothetical protein